MKKSNFNKFLLLWFGEFISSIGGGLTSFGLGVYVFKQTGSAAGMALVSLLAFLPTLLLSAPAGVLADKYDRRLLMMIGDGFSGLGVVYILVCMMKGGASLTQICIGVFVSSVFSSLLEPAYRATVSDILTKEEFSRANGMVSLAGSARYLISPILAGGLLAISDIKLLLVIDICTFILTVISTSVVRKGIETKKNDDDKSFVESLKEGFDAVAGRKGVLYLVIVSSIMTTFMGAVQILSEPLILSFKDSTTLGILETFCACGMLVTSIILGAKGIKKGYVKILCVSLALAGVFMVAFGLIENVIIVAGSGFLFFAMLPYANNCLDYLVRTNIPDELMGRAWGVIGFMSQIGYVVAYGISGILADAIANGLNISVGRGSAIVIMASGVLLALTAAVLYNIKEVRAMEA